MTAKEIAKFLDLPLSTVNWRLHALGLKAPFSEKTIEILQEEYPSNSQLMRVPRTSKSKGGRQKENKTQWSWYQVNKAKVALHIAHGQYANHKPTEEEWKAIEEWLKKDVENKVEKKKQSIEKKQAEYNSKKYHFKKQHKLPEGTKCGFFFNYIVEEDLLPLSQAIKRGIYDEEGHLCVFKDPTFKPVRLSRTMFLKDFLRSRGYHPLVTFDEDTLERHVIGWSKKVETEKNFPLTNNEEENETYDREDYYEPKY